MTLTPSDIDNLLETNLDFYEALRLRKRRPKTAAQRQFQDVAWGKAEPVTDHEHAYVHYLRQHRIGPFAPTPSAHIDDNRQGYTAGARPVSQEVGAKWDNAWRGRRGGREFW
ncbi:hypothetical protein [Croceicoccus marinus]|uniref:Uncharacterized protein n=1 Tax=Croceicoccus marinus TaxID=450378 RepID=A0A7G6W196_9SPHN|nr:hypothetical protein [Croceicoccus marinus]QNE07761.1 hypothetical protein H4O24_19635 [Croceicoccus marinus]